MERTTIHFCSTISIASPTGARPPIRIGTGHEIHPKSANSWGVVLHRGKAPKSRLQSVQGDDLFCSRLLVKKC